MLKTKAQIFAVIHIFLQAAVPSPKEIIIEDQSSFLHPWSTKQQWGVYFGHCIKEIHRF